MHLSFLWQSKHKEDTFAARPILLDDPKAEVYFFPCFAFLIYVYIFPFFDLFTLFFILLFSNRCQAISIYHLVGEEAPVEAGVSAGVASTEGTVPKKEEVSTATDIPMEVFLMVLTLLLRP